MKIGRARGAFFVFWGRDPMSEDLTDKQQAFIEHYLICMNASEAARRAGYSKRSAGSIGSENLQKPEIARVIESRMDGLRAQSNEVLARLTRQARGSMADFLSVTNKQVEIKFNQDAPLDLIKKIRIKPGEYGKEIELELYDSQKALELLGKYHKLFTDKVEIDWQSELEAAGIDASQEFETLKKAISERLRAGAARDDEGSASGS